MSGGGIRGATLLPFCPQCAAHNGAHYNDCPLEPETLAREQLRDAAPELLRVLELCAAQFKYYADEHEIAGKDAKAETNRRFEMNANFAIAKARGAK